MKIGLSQTPRPDVQQFSREEASPALLTAATELENRFAIRFAKFFSFPEETLRDLHENTGLPESVTIASRSDQTIAGQIQELSRIVNLPSDSITMEQRKVYRDTLLAIYSELPFRPQTGCEDSGTLFVGIEREGRILAEALGCLPPGHSVCPNAKRIHVGHGLAVGLTATQPPLGSTYDKCVIIDGAIASGATLIAMMENFRAVLRPENSGFEIYSVHATFEGLRALTRYASFQRIALRITVGHATDGLNESYYATQPANPGRVVVGDLGDTISPLDLNQKD